MKCLLCGSPVLANGYCSDCGLRQDYLKKAFNTSNYLYNIALDKAKVRDLSGATEVLERALQYNKRNTDARNLLGLIYYEKEEVVEALSHWVISANYDDFKNPAERYIKEIQSSAAKLDEANQVAKRYNQALYYLQQGSKDLALIQLKRILGSHTHFIKGYLLLALLYMDNGNFDKAKKAIKRVMRVDKNNTLAIKYLYEMGESPKNIMAYRDEAGNLRPIDDDSDEYDEPEEEDDYDERAPSIGAIVEQQLEAAASDGSLKIGNYKEVNAAKYTLVYVIVGLVLGVAVTYFLFTPSKINSVVDEYKDIKLTYSDELAKKNVTIADLQSKVDDLSEENETLKAANEAASTDDSVTVAYENLLAANNYYLANDKVNAVGMLVGIDSSVYTSETTQNMYSTIMANCASEGAASFYETGKASYDAGKYTEAIDSLSKAYNLNGEEADYLYYLAMAYQSNGDSEKAKELFVAFKDKYPNNSHIADVNQYIN